MNPVRFPAHGTSRFLARCRAASEMGCPVTDVAVHLVWIAGDPYWEATR